MSTTTLPPGDGSLQSTPLIELVVWTIIIAFPVVFALWWWAIHRFITRLGAAISRFITNRRLIK